MSSRDPHDRWAELYGQTAAARPASAPSPATPPAQGDRWAELYGSRPTAPEPAGPPAEHRPSRDEMATFLSQEISRAGGAGMPMPAAPKIGPAAAPAVAASDSQPAAAQLAERRVRALERPSIGPATPGARPEPPEAPTRPLPEAIGHSFKALGQVLTRPNDPERAAAMAEGKLGPRAAERIRETPALAGREFGTTAMEALPAVAASAFPVGVGAETALGGALGQLAGVKNPYGEAYRLGAYGALREHTPAGRAIGKLPAPVRIPFDVAGMIAAGGGAQVGVEKAAGRIASNRIPLGLKDRFTRSLEDRLLRADNPAQVEATGVAAEGGFRPGERIPVRRAREGLFERPKREAPESAAAPRTTPPPTTEAPPPTPEPPGRSEAASAPVSQAPADTERQPTPPNGRSGREETSFFPGNGEKVKTRYELVEADQLTPSHNAQSFEPSAGYPAEIQGRAYHGERGRAARESVIRQTERFDPELALDPTASVEGGVPTVTAEGHAVAGNQRVMMIQRLAKEHPEKYAAYRQALEARAEQFGLDPAAGRDMQHPVLVRRIVDPAVDTGNVDVLRRLNASSDVPKGKTKDVLSDASTRAAQLRSSRGALEHFASTIGDDQTIRQYLETADGREFGKRLLQDGVITEGERARYFDATTGTPTQEGKQLLERTLQTAAIGDADVISRAPDNMLRKLDSALPAIVRASTIEGYDLGPQVREALDLLASARANDVKVGDLIAQVDPFATPPDPRAAAMAQFLEGARKNEVTAAFRGYAEDAAQAGRYAEQAGDMFGFEPPSQEQAVGQRFRRGEAALSVGRKKPAADQLSLFERHFGGDATESPRAAVAPPAAAEAGEAAGPPPPETAPQGRFQGRSIEKLATEANYGTSFSPEKRAAQHVAEYDAALADMRQWLEKNAPADQVDELYNDFAQGFDSRYRAYLEAKGRTMSPMVTGGSNFPVRRNAKRMDVERRRLEELLDFERKAKARMQRQIKRANLPDDPHAATRQEIEKNEKLLETMKAANKIVRKKGLSDAERVAQLQELGLSEKTARTVLEPDFTGNPGFRSSQLTSLNGKIKRLRGKLGTIESATSEPRPFDGGEIVEDIQADRLRIHFDEKPDAATIEQLKRRGFRWSRREGAWQRQLTNAARADADRIVGSGERFQSRGGERALFVGQDLFGNDVHVGPEQGSLLPESSAPQGMSRAEQEARQTISLLEGKVRRGAASAAEQERYQAARSLLRRGKALDADEVAARARTAEEKRPTYGDTSELFPDAPKGKPEPLGRYFTREGSDRTALLHRNTIRQDKPYRITWMEGGQPGFHVSFDTPEEALKHLAEEGYAEKPLPAGTLGQGAIGTPMKKGFRPLSVRSEHLPEAGRFSTGTAAEAPRPSKIIGDLQEALHLPVREGKLGVGRRIGQTLGIYKVRPEVVRLGRIDDVTALGHEIGHHLHKLWLAGGDQLDESHLALAPFAEDLHRLAAGISDGSLSEGWAEVWRRYIDNPEAFAALERSSPKLYEYVEAKLEQFPEVRTVLDQARDDWRLYREASPQARVRAKISTEEEPRNLAIRDRLDRIRTDVLDDFHPIKKAVEAMSRGDPVDFKDDAYSLAQLVRGSVGAGEHFLERGTLNFRTGAINGKSLTELLKPVADNLDDFRDYVVARRALELEKRGVESGIRPEDAQWVVDQVERGKSAEGLGAPFQQAARDLYAYNGRMLEYLRDAGVISQGTLDSIRERNLEYVPFYRAVDEGGGRGGFGLGFGHLFSPVKRIKGSGRDIIDPLESIVKNTYLYTHLAQKQQVSAALGRLAERAGVGETIEKLPMPVKPVSVSLGDVRKKLESIFGEDLLDELEQQAERDFAEATHGLDADEIKAAGITKYDPAEELLTAFRPGDYFNKPNIISVLRGGKRAWYEVEPDLYRALEGLDREQLDGWVRWMSKPAEWLRAGATLAPEFQLRNPLRDQVMAFVQSEYGFTPGVDFARGMFSFITKDDHYWTWLRSGGANATLVGLDRKSMRETVDTLLHEGTRVRNVLKSPIEALRALSELMENGTRLGEFRRALAVEGRSKVGAQKAALAARGVSVDFARHGAKTIALRHLVAFWNARLQGYDRLIQAFKSNPSSVATRAFTAITLPSVLLYAVNRDDPEYHEIPQWKRDLFWMVKVGGTWVSIPKPFELGMVFGTMPERILEWADSHDPEGMGEFFRNTVLGEVTSTFDILPTAMTPIVENVANYSFFLKRPIVPEGMKRVEPRFQAGQYTSEVAKQLGQWTGASPLKIDNLLVSWTGGLGRAVSGAIDLGVEAAHDPGEAAGDVLSAKPADVPGLRGVVTRSPGFSSESIERFYRAYNDAETVNSSKNLLEKERDPERLRAYLQDPDNARLLARLRAYRRTADRLAELRAKAKIVRRSRSLSVAERKQKEEELGKQATELARSAIGRELPQ